MKDVLRVLAARQAGCVASWQLRNAGWSWDAIRHRTRGLRRLHDGVFVTGDAPVTRLQRWWAATLTAPGSVLAFASAGAAYEMRPWESTFEVVARRGHGGPRRHGTLLVYRTKHLHATTLDGLPITTPERTLADLWPSLDNKAQGNLLRNALRLKLLTIPSLKAHLQQASAKQRPRTRRPGWRGTSPSSSTGAAPTPRPQPSSPCATRTSRPQSSTSASPARKPTSAGPIGA